VRIHHVALRTPDVGRLERFYTDVLGMRVGRRDEARGSVWMEADAAVVMLEPLRAGEPRVPDGSMELLAFALEPGSSLQGWRSRLAELGIALDGSTEHTIYLRDPDGRRIGISDYPFGQIRG
jgi:catechol 2,3-dioxygenase-like lactoylglutathione lyase family enzyme